MNLSMRISKKKQCEYQRNNDEGKKCILGSTPGLERKEVFVKPFN